MSRENMEIVRQRMRLRDSSQRRLEERVLLRFPWVGEAFQRLVFGLSPRSRLRMGLVRHSSQLALEAANRGDYDAAFALIPAYYETIVPPELVDIGFDPAYHGREGRLRMQLTWIAELGEFHQEAQEILDLGDHIVLLGQMMFTGRSSDVPLQSEVAYWLTIEDGRLVREHTFRSHDEALEAVGVRE
jgi:hypothetical protein